MVQNQKGKGPERPQVQKLRPREGMGRTHVTQQTPGRAGYPGFWFGSASRKKMRAGGEGADGGTSGLSIEDDVLCPCTASSGISGLQGHQKCPVGYAHLMPRVRRVKTVKM